MKHSVALSLAAPPELFPADVSDPDSLFLSFDHPWLSPDGSQWAINAFTNQTFGGRSPSADGFLIRGAGPTRDGAVATAVEGTDFNGALPADDLSGFFDSRIGLNDAGQYSFVNNTVGDSATDEHVFRAAGSTFQTVAQEDTTSFGTTVVNTISDASMMPNGDWFLIGQDNAFVDFVV